MTLELALMAGVCVLLLLVAWGTITRNGLGINVLSVTCPRCIRRQPRLRPGLSMRQILFGGGTCPEWRTLFDQ